jgi:hypothetical protein|mmetsp:Transcript_13436/g.21285  ORF Transcript_13436/g.21285 Transcript_13436/m.21285 type:complete len:118 (-) Transcript_13436:1995-2348(-)
MKILEITVSLTLPLRLVETVQSIHIHVPQILQRLRRQAHGLEETHTDTDIQIHNHTGTRTKNQLHKHNMNTEASNIPLSSSRFLGLAQQQTIHLQKCSQWYIQTHKMVRGESSKFLG